MNELTRLAALAQRHALPFNDGHLIWHSWGSELTGRPVVLFHGGSGCWNHWIRNIEFLTSLGRPVWIPDLPGFGDSARPVQGEDVDAMPEPIEWSIKQLIGEQVFDVVGFSFGSMLAALIAEDWPQQVRSLTVIGAPALGVNAKRPFKLRPWLGHAPGPERDAIHRHNLGVLMLSSPEKVDDLAVAIHSQNLARDRMQKRRLAYSTLLLDCISAIDTPVYGIWGEADVLYRGTQEELKLAMASARNLQWLKFVSDAGHWVQYEKPAEFNTLLAQAIA